MGVADFISQWEAEQYMAKNSYKDLTAFFTPPKYADQKNLKEKNIPWWLF